MVRIVWTLAAAGAVAAPALGQISVTETTDFSGSAASPTVITPPVGLGINTISGRVNSVGGSLDVDAFRLQFPAGLSVDAISITISSYVAGTWPGSLGLSGTGNSGLVTYTGNGTFNLTPFTFDATTNVFTVGGQTLGPPVGITRPSYNYTVSVSVIPAPAAAGVLGMGALAGLRRRRR